MATFLKSTVVSWTQETEGLLDSGEPGFVWVGWKLTEVTGWENTAEPYLMLRNLYIPGYSSGQDSHPPTQIFRIQMSLRLHSSQLLGIDQPGAEYRWSNQTNPTSFVGASVKWAPSPLRALVGGWSQHGAISLYNPYREASTNVSWWLHLSTKSSWTQCLTKGTS